LATENKLHILDKHNVIGWLA